MQNTEYETNVGNKLGLFALARAAVDRYSSRTPVIADIEPVFTRARMERKPFYFQMRMAESRMESARLN